MLSASVSEKDATRQTSSKQREPPAPSPESILKSQHSSGDPRIRAQPPNPIRNWSSILLNILWVTGKTYYEGTGKNARTNSTEKSPLAEEPNSYQVSTMGRFLHLSQILRINPSHMSWLMRLTHRHHWPLQKHWNSWNFRCQLDFRHNFYARWVGTGYFTNYNLRQHTISGNNINLNKKQNLVKWTYRL